MKILTDDIFDNFEKYRGFKVKSLEGIVYTIYEMSEGDILLVTNKVNVWSGFALSYRVSEPLFLRAVSDGYYRGFWIFSHYKEYLGKLRDFIFEIIEDSDNILISEKEINLFLNHLNFKLLNS